MRPIDCFPAALSNLSSQHLMSQSRRKLPSISHNMTTASDENVRIFNLFSFCDEGPSCLHLTSLCSPNNHGSCSSTEHSKLSLSDSHEP